MALESLTGFIYELVRQSWVVSTFLVKYILLLGVVQTYRAKGADLDYFQEFLIGNSKEIVSIIVILGFLNVFVRFEIDPMFKIVSQVIALVFFGYLFWKY